MASVKPVIIDEGTFKYIQLVVSDGDKKQTVIRGYSECPYHGDIFDKEEAILKKDHANIKLDCPGGGRIKHDKAAKSLKIYGYSQGYGKANHSLTAEILRREFPDYEISISDEGY